MLGFTSQPATSIRQVQHVIQTVKATDDKISRMRKDITTNKVPNQGLAMKHVQQLEQQNSARKAWLVKNRQTINSLGVNAAKNMTPPRDSFMTPDGPRHYGNKSAPFISINDLQKSRPVSLPKPRMPTIDTPQNIPPKTVPPGGDLKKQQDLLRLKQIEEQKRRVEMLKKKADIERQKKLIEEGRLKQAQMVGRNRIKEDLRKAQEGTAPGSNTANAIAKNAKDAVKRAQENANKNYRLRQVAPQPAPNVTPQITPVVRDAQKAQQEQKIRTGSKMVIYKGVEYSLSEPTNVFVTRLYRQLLRREPDSGGLNHWTRVLRTRRMTHNQVIDGFLNSQEYKRKQQKRAAPTQDKQREQEVLELAMNPPARLLKFLEEVEDASSKGDLPEKASPFVEARVNQFMREFNNLLTRYKNGSIKQDLVATKKMIDKLVETFIKDVQVIIQKYSTPKPQPINQGMAGVPRNINIPVHRQITLNGMDKRSLAPIRTEQERGAQMGDNLGALFPALRRSMQGVLKQ